MITGKDLMDWGMIPGPIFKTALKVLGTPHKEWGKPKVKVAFQTMLNDPEAFVAHPLLSPIAQEIVRERKERIEKQGSSLNDKGCPIHFYGRELIEQEAVNQICTASKLPISLQAACMPDAHAGYGLPIGGVLATDGAVIPYAVGVDIGCFTGDTQIALANGKNISFCDMISEQALGIRHFGYSRKNDNSIVITELRNARQTRVVNTLIEVSLDNGVVYRCTEDHIHYDVNGKEVRAEGLYVGQSLLPLYIKKANEIPPNKRSYTDKRMKLKDYLMVYNPASDMYDFVHFLSDDFNLRHHVYDKSSGNIRHHVDFEKTNNDPTNIQRVEWKEHFYIHSSHVRQTNSEGKTCFKVARSLHPDFFAKLGSVNMSRLHTDPAFAARRNVRARNNICGFNSHKEQNRKLYEENGLRGSSFLIEKNKSEKGRRQASVNAHITYICPVCHTEVVGGFGIRNHAVSSPCKNRLFELKQKHGSYCFEKVINHKVVAIRRISCLKTPVYCLSEVENANFALAGGVFVHNCRMQMTVFDMPFRLAKGQQGRLTKILNENTVFGAGHGIDIKFEHSVFEHEAFKIPRIKKLHVLDKAREQIGTSGGGNHFVEFGSVEMPGMAEPMLAVLSHSGSRGVGFAVANEYTKIAMEKCKLPDQAKHLAWLSLSEEDGQEYWMGMEMSGAFAKACHDIIHDRIRRALWEKVLLRLDNHHNFAWKEIFQGREVIVHRKGATPAGIGMTGLIPGSMTTPTMIVRGKGNEDSICSSSSHGAGRAMSRSAAKEKFTDSQLRKNLADAGVTLIGGAVDESSMAYKDIHKVMEAQKDLVEIIGQFNPFVVKMAGEERKPWEPE